MDEAKFVGYRKKMTSKNTNIYVSNRQLEYGKNKNLQFSSKNYFLESFLKQNRSSATEWKSENLKISDQAAKSLLKVCRESDLSLYILMVALFKGIVARYTNQSSITVLSPVYQADPGSSIKEYVVLQDKVTISADLIKNVQETRKTIIEAYSNQAYFTANPPAEIYCSEGLEKILEQNVLCLLDNIHKADNIFDKSPLTIHLHRENKRINGTVSYDKERMHEGLIKEFCGNFSQFIEHASQNFKQRIEDIDLLSDSGLNRMLEYSRGRTTSVPTYKLHQLFEEQVEKTPEQIALIYNDEKITYQKLNEMANKAARGLIAYGVKPEDYVLLMFTRGIEMIATILAVLKTGAAFIPVSPEEPEDRLNFILTEADARLILTNQRNLKINVEKEFLTMDSLVSPSSETPVGNLDVEFDHKAAAYVIFTSGSTGLPKGVVIEHHSIVNANIWRKQAYRFSTESIELLLFAYNFDGFVLNLFTPMISGATIVLINESEVKDPQVIAEYIEKYRITHFTSIPLLYHAVLEQCSREQISSLKRVTLAADVAEPKTILLSKELHDELIISNEYGPTENSVIATYNKEMKAESVRVIGRPIDNVRSYILDAKQDILPIGIFGELYLGNQGLAREYLNNPELTETAFIQWRGERLYRTGDLARWLPDGTIEFKGRRDHQVNLRGFRIELEEIRNCLLLHNAVNEAVVVMLGENSDAGLYACITLQQEISIDHLKNYVSHKLPFYMVPQQFIVFADLPVNESGKYDITAIKREIRQYNEPEVKELPANDIEQRLLEIWKDLLNVEDIGVNQNFFTLGGHSLKATTLLSKIYQVFKVGLSLNQIFITNTVKELAKEIENLKGNQVENIPKVPKRDYYTLSSAQERILVLGAMNNLGMTYNTPLAFSITGHLDVKRLQYALHALVQRHESLRTSFVFVDDKPVQIIHDTGTVSISILEKTIADDSNIAEGIIGLLSTFDLAKAPLFQVILLRVSETKTYLIFDFHHIIIDETSLAIFFNELIKLYNTDKLTELSLSYKDYAAWQRERQKSEDYKKKLDYWINKLSGIELQPLNLPYDYSRENRVSYEGSRIQTGIKTALFEAIREFCESSASTHFMFFLAAFTLLLNKYTNQKEIIIGSPVSEREHPETRDIVGLFLNTIPLLSIVDNDLSFLDFLQTIKSSVLKDISNSEVAFDDLVKAINLEKKLDINPIFNVMLSVMDNNVTNLQFETCQAEKLDVHNKTSKFDFLLEVYTSESEIVLNFEYSTGLFSEAKISRIVRSFGILIENIVKKPAAPLADLQIINDADRTELLKLARFNCSDSGCSETIISLFEKQALERPTEIALVLENEELTYEELNKRANKLAHEIKKLISPEDIVAILCQRSFAAIINILAVQKAGGAYLPLDIAYPKARINHILSASGTRVLLTDQNDLPTINFSGKIIHPDQINLSGNSDTNLEITCTPGSLAYVLYTSGTTGEPKGVSIEHKSVVNLITTAPSYYQIGTQDVWTMFHTYCFDVSVWEMYGALLYGGRLLIVPHHVSRDPGELLNMIIEKDVTILCLTPSAFNMLAEEMKGSVRETSLHYIILAGEALRPYKLKEWYPYYKQIKLINAYGITETTVYSTYKEITGYEIKHNICSIGSPLPNNYMYVLDENMVLCPIGVLGEIYIGGRGVGRGYFKNQELTNNKFLQDPFAPGQRIYRTGDLARWLPNGEIEYISRLDHQVKIRGFRVEISEIESVLSKYETIKDIFIMGLDDEANNTQLAAYFTSTQKENITQIRAHLEHYLPHYMLPAYIIQIDELPLSKNGKVDRSKLPNPKAIYHQEIRNRETTTPLEKLLVDVLAEILDLSSEQISMDDNFFHQGGDSIHAVQLVRRLKNYNIEAIVDDIIDNKTIAGICDSITARQAKEHQDTSDAGLSERPDYWKDLAGKEVKPLPKGIVLAIKSSNESKKPGENSNQDSHKDEVVNQVEPFNEVFYKDCYYQALIPAIHYFGGNFQLLFANCNSIYEVDETSKNVKFKNSYISYKADQELFHALGLNVNKFFDSQNICEDLMYYLSQGALAIVNVDCYYVTRKKELYQKKHWSHSMLVYGYCKKDHLFHIIDNQKIMSMSYQKNAISFDELKTAYLGYNDNFNALRQQGSFFTIFKINGDTYTNYDNESIRMIAIENLQKMKYKLLDSKNALNFLYTNFINITSNEQMMMANVSQLNYVIGEILAAKRIELYKIKNILKNEAIAETLDGIVKYLEYIRNVLTKMEMSQKYNDVSAVGMQKKLKQIVDLEKLYVSYINKELLLDI
ncbi:MAG: amino acid adenylation domain-containing protein [Candidatus Aminicenantes bacterium]